MASSFWDVGVAVFQFGPENLKHHLKTLTWNRKSAPQNFEKAFVSPYNAHRKFDSPSLRGDLRSSNVRTSAARSTLRCVAACLQRGYELRARQSSDEAEWLCYIHDAANFKSARFDMQSLQGRQSSGKLLEQQARQA